MPDSILADVGTADEALPVGRMRRKKGTTVGRDYSPTKGKPMAKLTAKQRNALPASSFAVPGKRELPIHDAEHVRKAVQLFTTTKGLTPAEKATAKRKIRAAAQKFGVKINSSAFMEAEDLNPILALEFDFSSANVSPTEDDSGVMRLRVPFYRGNSVARPSGWSEPLFFSADALPGIIAEGKKVIAAGKLQLTVFPRHADRNSHSSMHVGIVTDLEKVGNDGYAILEIAPTDRGNEIQTLVRSKHLNAVSLASNPGFELDEVKVNGELMYTPAGMTLAGIDFAPEGPAMDTFGAEVLLEATVEPYTSEEDTDDMEEITLEAVREHPDIVTALTKPHTDKVAQLEADLKTQKDAVEAAQARVVALEARLNESEVAQAIEELASRAPKPKKARKLLAESCKDCKSKADVYALATPLLLEALDAAREGRKPKEGEKPSFQSIFAESFHVGGRGASDKPDTTHDDNEPVPGAGFLPIPD